MFTEEACPLRCVTDSLKLSRVMQEACMSEAIQLCIDTIDNIADHSHVTPGMDLGFSERGVNHSSGSLKQGVWGHSPAEAGYIGYFVL